MKDKAEDPTGYLPPGLVLRLGKHSKSMSKWNIFLDR